LIPLLEAFGLGLQVADRGAQRWFRSTSPIALFRDVDLAVEPGESVGIVGESGSGKTSLARTLLRLYEPTAGSLRFQGRDITHASEAALRPLRAHVQSIFQDPLSALNPRHRIRTILSQPLLAFARVKDKREGWRKACMLLERVGLPADFGMRFPHELSGGERQRVGIARALALEPALIIADEILSGLDVSTQAQVLTLLREIRAHTALVFISHDLAVVRAVCGRVLVMREGSIVESGPCERVFSEPAHAYTRMLLDAIPLPEPDSTWIAQGNSTD
jgi:peptide/nickel transport system ATP-binding protein